MGPREVGKGSPKQLKTGYDNRAWPETHRVPRPVRFRDRRARFRNAFATDGPNRAVKPRLAPRFPLRLGGHGGNGVSQLLTRLGIIFLGVCRKRRSRRQRKARKHKHAPDIEAAPQPAGQAAAPTPGVDRLKGRGKAVLHRPGLPPSGYWDRTDCKRRRGAAPAGLRTVPPMTSPYHSGQIFP